MEFRCKVCGKPVNPDKDILFGALGNPLFAAHAEVCAPLVRDTTQTAGRIALDLLQARKPELHKSLIDSVAMAKRVLAAVKGP